MFPKVIEVSSWKRQLGPYGRADHKNLSMCAIVDANVTHEVFGSKPVPAGEGFLRCINRGGLTLVAGGRLLDELRASSEDFRRWASEAIRGGKMRIIGEQEVYRRTMDLQRGGECRSDDPHIIALAQVSGARLLYSNDVELQKDFANKDLIDKPRGRVYSTRMTKDFIPARRKLLARKDLCEFTN